MADVILTATKRAERGSGPAGRLRRAGRLPAVVYGLEREPLAVTVPARELEHILHGESGANTVITLDLEGEQAIALARQIQRDPTRGDLVHVDFVRVRADVAVSAEVPLNLEGEAPGVREGGIIEQLLFSVTVSARPADIPTHLTVDISTLNLGDQLHISDIAVPAGVELQHEADELVVQVAVPRGMAGAEEEEGAEGAEGEEGAEGGAAPGGGEGGEAGGE
jgi:large subunit ribosomal protein L25